MPRNKSWFKMEKKTVDLAEIEIFDEIDSFWGLGPKEFKAKFDEVKDAKSIKLLLNSPGGSVFDGMAIYNILATARDRLEVEVIGLAASIASIIALAGNKLTMAEGSYYMIHNPWTFAMGDGEELRKTADILDKMSSEFVKMYVAKTGLSEDEVKKMMADETWLTASEAIDKGFADDSEDYGQIAAKIDGCAIAKHFAHIPEALAVSSEPKQITNPRDLEALLRDSGGMSRSQAVAIVANGWKALDRGEPEPSPQGEPARVPAITAAMLIQEMDLA
jgi:ATP-dependent Clp protease, protease subunit